MSTVVAWGHAAVKPESRVARARGGVGLQWCGGALERHGRGYGLRVDVASRPIEAFMVASEAVQRNPMQHSCWRLVVQRPVVVIARQVVVRPRHGEAGRAAVSLV
jgi:hypothetical protein